MTFTDDRSQWWELEHAFAGFMTTLNRGSANTKEATEYLEEYLETYYEWFLEYCRGLEQEDYVELVRMYAPELLKMVEE